MIDSEHVTLINFSTWQSEFKELHCGALHIIQHCLCINIGVAHNEVCKWLIKNGPPMNFAERESDQLFLHQERKSAKYYAESWVSFDKYFQLIASMWTSRLKPINCNYFCWPSDYN